MPSTSNNGINTSKKKRRRSESSNASKHSKKVKKAARTPESSRSGNDPARTKSNTTGDDDKEWLETIKKGVEAEFGEKWQKEAWTDFSVEVARLLRNRHLDSHVIEALVGLLKARVESEESLKSISKNRNDFISLLKEEGIGLGISAFLFDKYCNAGGRAHGNGDSPPSPGTAANDARNYLQRLIAKIQQTGFAVEIQGDDDPDWHSHFKDNSKTLFPGVGLLNKLYDSVGVPTDADAKEHELSELNFLLLQKQGETQFQQGHLQDFFFNVTSASALDLSNSNREVGPFFKPASKVDGMDGIVSLMSAKPDAASSRVPMELEIKSDKASRDSLSTVDYEVLYQAVERVSMRMHNQGFLKMAFAFAVTGRSAWYLRAERLDRSATATTKVELKVNRIRHKDVGLLWMGVTMLAKNQPGFYLVKNGAAICDVLNKMGVAPWCCRIKALASSQYVVYGVTVPKKYGKETGVDVTRDEITYAVKIIDNHEDYQTESEALQEIAKKAMETGTPDFYALGCAPITRAGPATNFLGNAWETGLTYEMNENYWWGRSHSIKGREGGAIIMRVGGKAASQEYDKQQALPKAVVSNLLKSLRLAHSVGILHCDLRRSNFVRFGKQWQVIDYSASTTEHSREFYSMGPGAQAECAGDRVKDMYQKQAQFHWTKEDDYEMLISNIL